MTSPVWSGVFFLEVGRALYLGPAFETEVHAHHAVQVCLALETKLALRRAEATRWQQCTAAVVAADQAHELAASGRRVALLYLDPEGRDGRRSKTGRALVVLPPRRAEVLRREVRALLDSTLDERGARAVIDTMIRGTIGVLTDGNDAVRPLDARVERSLARLRTAAAAEYPSSEAVARTLGCSAGRLRHLFRQQVGLGYRSYVLWLRLLAAVEEVAAGASLTTAAHAAGFSDSAHLTRTFRRMFGVAPSMVPPAIRLLSARH